MKPKTDKPVLGVQILRHRGHKYKSQSVMGIVSICIAGRKIKSTCQKIEAMGTKRNKTEMVMIYENS